MWRGSKGLGLQHFHDGNAEKPFWGRKTKDIQSPAGKGKGALCENRIGGTIKGGQEVTKKSEVRHGFE